jgi:hypothetical protein
MVFCFFRGFFGFLSSFEFFFVFLDFFWVLGFFSDFGCTRG